MPDRKHIPLIASEWESPELPFEKFELKNGIPCYFINSGSSELLKIEWIFDAGASASNKFLLPAMTADMLKEGTELKDSATLAEAFDNYGSFFGVDFSQDHSSISLFCLNKNLAFVLPLVKEVLTLSNFPEKELKLLVQNSKQKIALNNEKVAHVSRKTFMQNLFGDDHPYGHYGNNDDLDFITRDEIIHFYNSYYSPERCKIVVSGNIPESFIDDLDVVFGSNNWGKIFSDKDAHIVGNLKDPTEKKVVHASKPKALQSAIRIGKKVINKHHPDIHNLVILNTILGGYFGSRLMSNIREDKGYTYGIGSGVFHLKHGSFLSISTEVGADVCSDAIKEIYFEINRLLDEEVGVDELKTVTSYLAGTFLRSMDGPFEKSEKLKNLLIWELDINFYAEYMAALKNVNPAIIRKTAQRFLGDGNWLEVFAGPNIE